MYMEHPVRERAGNDGDLWIGAMLSHEIRAV